MCSTSNSSQITTSSVRNVCDYFVCVGLPTGQGASSPVRLENPSNPVEKEDALKDPITDITIINFHEGEVEPPGYECVRRTVGDNIADLNHGTFMEPQLYLCYRRGRDKPPLVDIRVWWENGKELPSAGYEVLRRRPYQDRSAAIKASKPTCFLTYRRASSLLPDDLLAVTDIGVLMANKEEKVPHTYQLVSECLNKGFIGSSMYICFKRTEVNWHMIAYRPQLLSRYPLVDDPGRPDFRVQELPDFCLPMGAAVEVWPQERRYPSPSFFTFLLTDAQGDRDYGAVLTFYDRYEKRLLSETDQKQLGLFKSPTRFSTSSAHTPDTPKSLELSDTNPLAQTQTQAQAQLAHSSDSPINRIVARKSIAIISRWPLFDLFRSFLIFLYKYIHYHIPNRSVPIERYIVYLLKCVPFPTLEKPKILLQLSPSGQELTISLPEERPIPVGGASFVALLESLPVDKLLDILALVILPKKICVHSTRLPLLMQTCEAFIAMVFPLRWIFPLIPVCPMRILAIGPVWSSPTPLIMGVDSRYFTYYNEPSEDQIAFCVDLDTGNILNNEKPSNLAEKLLPKKSYKWLKNTLEKLKDSVLETSTAFRRTKEDMSRRRRQLAAELEALRAQLKSVASDVATADSSGASPSRAVSMDPADPAAAASAGVESTSSGTSVPEPTPPPSIPLTDPRRVEFEQLNRMFEAEEGRRKNAIRRFELQIQDTFLRFMMSLLYDYKRYLIPQKAAPSNTSPKFESIFFKEGFVKSRDKSAQKTFFEEFVGSQLFQEFIYEVSGFSLSPNSFARTARVGLSLFDDLCERFNPNTFEIQDRPRYSSEAPKYPVQQTAASSSAPNKFPVYLLPPSIGDTTTVLAMPEHEGATARQHNYHSSFPELNERLLIEHYADLVRAQPLLHAMRDGQTADYAAAALDAVCDRVQQEIAACLKYAEECRASEKLWARCLQYTSMCLWFLHLPSYVAAIDPSKSQGLQFLLHHAYNLLFLMCASKFEFTDQVCQRVLIQLCAQAHSPYLAVQIFSDMETFGIRPSAYTYGLYNKAIVDAKWHLVQPPTSAAKPVETGSSTAINSSGSPSEKVSTSDLTRIPYSSENLLSSSAGLMQSASAPVTKALKPERAISSGALDIADSGERRDALPPLQSERRDSSAPLATASTLTPALLSEQPSVRERNLSANCASASVSASASTTRARPKSGGAFAHHAVPKPIIRGDVAMIPSLRRQISNSTMRRVEEQVGIVMQSSAPHCTSTLRADAFAHKHRSVHPNQYSTLNAAGDASLVASLHASSTTSHTLPSPVSLPRDFATTSADHAPSTSATEMLGSKEQSQSQTQIAGDSTHDQMASNTTPRTPKKSPPPRPPLPKQGFLMAASSPTQQKVTIVSANALREHSDLHPSYLSPMPAKPPAVASTELGPGPIQAINPLNAPAGAESGESVSTRSLLSSTLAPTLSRLTSQLSGSLLVSLMQKQAANIMKPLYNQSKPYRPRRFSRRLPTARAKPGALAEEQPAAVEKETGSNSPAGTSDDNDVDESDEGSEYLEGEGYSEDEAQTPDVQDSWEDMLEPLAPQLPPNSRQCDLFTAPLPQLLTTELWQQKKFSAFIAQRHAAGQQYSGSAVSTPTSYSKLLRKSRRSPEKQRLSTAHSMPLLDADDGALCLENSAHLNSFNPNTSQPVEAADLRNRTTSLQNVSQSPAPPLEFQHSIPNAELVDTSQLDASSANSEQAAAQAKSIESLQSTQNVQSQSQSTFLNVHLCTMTQCSRCGLPVYDEEIQAGWRPADSNLNCICPFCKGSFVPLLHIYVRDQREHSAEASLESTSTTSAITTSDSRLSQGNILRRASSVASSSTLAFETLPSVPYLSPIVLRKEIESVLRQEGDRAFLALDFVDNHRAVYWNLLYYVKRSVELTFLPALILFSKHFTVNKVLSDATLDSNASVRGSTIISSDLAASQTNVQSAQNLLVLTDRIHVQLLWDDIHAALARNETPLYYLWKSNENNNAISNSLSVDISNSRSYSAGFMQKIVSFMVENRVENIFELILSERSHGSPSLPAIRNSIYREVLFLLMAACGDGAIDLGAYDREYRRVFEGLRRPPGERTTRSRSGSGQALANFPRSLIPLLVSCDSPPSTHASACRHIYSPLSLIH